MGNVRPSVVGRATRGRSAGGVAVRILVVEDEGRLAGLPRRGPAGGGQAGAVARGGEGGFGMGGGGGCGGRGA